MNLTLIDWTKLTNDPVDNIVRDQMVNYLFKIRSGLPQNDYSKYLSQEVKGKRTLDIGVCEHTQSRINSEEWKHDIIRKHASYSLGVDIIHDLVKTLKEKGYNVIQCDATSEEDLGDRFEIIHVGDVIEHVDSPVALMKFCKRHIKEDGKIVVRTPNPYNFNYVYLHNKVGTDRSNMEHMFYICPIHAMEIGRRSGLYLDKYFVLEPHGFTILGLKIILQLLCKMKFRHALAEIFKKPESYSTIYVYEFRNLPK